MKKLSAVALAAGILTASCSGHGGQSSLPSAPGSSPAHRSSTIALAPAGWASTATQGIVVRNAADTGALSPAQKLTVRVGLALHNSEHLAQMIAQRQIVSPGQFMAQYAPTAAEVNAVTSYLRSQGLTNIQTEPNNLLVSAEGTSGQVNAAFNTSLESFSLNGSSVFANTKPALVPQSLSGIVVAVLGLNNAVKFAPNPVMGACKGTTPPAGVPCIRRMDAHQMQTFYNAGNTPTGAQTTIAVMAEGDVTSTVADLRTAEVRQGLPIVPTTIRTVGYQTGERNPVALEEWAMDTQASTGIAGTVAHLYVYAATALVDSDITLEYNKWVTDNVAKLGNSSFGGCEYSNYLDGSMRIIDNILMQGAAQGQTMFASSGDTGSACNVLPLNAVDDTGPQMVEFPAASPWVVAVGGSTLTTNVDSTYMGEAAWNGSGGGLSQFENSTSWEQTQQPTGVGLAAANLRGVPDIAMAADPTAGDYNVYESKSCPNYCGIGGTSEAAPLAMGVYARLQSAHNNALGFAAPRFYNVYNTNTAGAVVTGPPPTQMDGGFHDLLTGNNTLYSATPGYDYVSGLGTMDITEMNRTI
ncbi:MAG: S53 family peptidase [Candidatus Eremiobacteraeota bacterium]|nr:S53 family peptidase [Candidatus Eremiobacteraeota bacterium]